MSRQIKEVHKPHMEQNQRKAHTGTSEYSCFKRKEKKEILKSMQWKKKDMLSKEYKKTERSLLSRRYWSLMTADIILKS